MNSMKLSVKKKKQLPYHLMLLPSVIILLVYVYTPMAGIIIAFQKYKPTKGFLRSPWVGLDQFKNIFTSDSFYNALGNTLYIALFKIVLGIVVPVLFAILLNEVAHKRLKKSIQTIIYLPHFISWVLLAGITMDLLSPDGGLVNMMLGAFNIEPIFFLGDNDWFPGVVLVTHTYKEFGWGTIIFLAAITGVNPNVVEAAMIDGANRFQRIRHVTLPAIKGIVILVSTLSLGNVLNAGFDQIFNLVSAITLESGDIIDTLVYRMGIENGNFSLATAAGLFKSVVSLVFITTAYRLADKLAGYKIF